MATVRISDYKLKILHEQVILQLKHMPSLVTVFPWELLALTTEVMEGRGFGVESAEEAVSNYMEKYPIYFEEER